MCPSMGLGGTGLVRSWLRPSEEGCGEMDAMGVTPKGLLVGGGVGETPLLEMVLPGVTAIPGAGDEPEDKKRGVGEGVIREKGISQRKRKSLY